MLRRYASDSDVLCELKTHLALGQWEVVEAFVKFLVSDSNQKHVNEILTSVALHPHLNSYCLEQNVRSPEHLAFLAARLLGDEKLSRDAAFRCMLREIPQLSDDMKYHLLEAFTHGSVPEQRVLNVLRQCCLLPRASTSLFIVLDILRLPQVTLECVLQVCVQMQQASSAWSVDQLMDKLQELVSFTPAHEVVPECLLSTLTERLIETVLPRRPERLLSLAVGCRNLVVQKRLLEAISHKQCPVSRARANGNRHFLELQLDEIVAAMIANEQLPENLPGTNLHPLALMFAWIQLPTQVAFNRLDELERLYPNDTFTMRLATIVRECRLISSVTKVPLPDLISQRQTQSLLRVIYSTGALRGMKDAQVIHIVSDEYQSRMLRGSLALKHVSTALHYAVLIADRRVDRNSNFQPRAGEAEPQLTTVHDVIKYIEQHGPDISFDALVTPELRAAEELLAELPSNELKVEVLEDIFSLLFVSHRELHGEEPLSDVDNDTNDSSSRYESSENGHGIRGSGFLASKAFIRTLLPILVTHILATKLQLTSAKGLLTRLERLLHYVTNARWRLELVEEKLPLSTKCVQKIDADDLSSSLTRSGGGAGIMTSTPPRRRRTARQRTKSYTANNHLEPRAPQASVVELLLSTHDALLRHCLWKGDYDRAQQVRKVATVDSSDVADGAELDFCLSIGQIEQELLSLQNDSESAIASGAIFSAIDSFLQATPLSARADNMCYFYMNLAMTSDLSLLIAHKLLAYAADISKNANAVTNHAYQAVNKGSALLATIAEKLTITGMCLDEALMLSTCHLDGVCLLEESLFWAALHNNVVKVEELLNVVRGKGSSNVELHQAFFRLGKLTGAGIRKYRTRLIQFTFDFTRALYAHARQVYKALEEKKQSLRLEHRPNGALADSSGAGIYLRVLEECSPSMTLLRLILHDNVPPAKLEEFASKMKLNITQCVSKEILPNLYMRTTSYSDVLHVRVLNGNGLSSSATGLTAGAVSDTTSNAGSNSATGRSSLAGMSQSGGHFSRNAAFVAQKLLSQLIDILREKCPCAKKPVMEKYDNLREVAFSAQFDRWRESTRELSNVDLTKLKTEERVVFFLNVLHCLSLERMIHRYRKGLPLIQSTLEGQIDDSLYAYEIGCMGAVTILQLKYTILFCGHSLPPLAAPLAGLALVEPQPFLPAQNMLTVFSLVQCIKDDPPLKVFESDSQLNEGFSRCVLKVNVDVENKKMYVPWQTEEIAKGSFFRNSPDRDILRFTLLKMGGHGFTLEFVRSGKFHLNLNPMAQPLDILERQLDTALRVPPTVIKYMEQHCAPIGIILQHTMAASVGERVERRPWDDVKGSSALERMLTILPDAKQTALSGNVAEDMWAVLESLMHNPDSVGRMLEYIDICDAVSGGQVVTSKLFYLKQRILKVLAGQSYRYVIRMKSASAKVEAFIENYVHWTDKDIENACKALRSVVPKDEPGYGTMVAEMERIFLYQAMGRLLQIEWRQVSKDIPWVIGKLREGGRYDFIHKISLLGLVDPNDTQLCQTVTELSACHHFSLNHVQDYEAGLRIVDAIADTEQRLSLCRRLLDQLTPCRGKLYLLRYMICKYSSEDALVKGLQTHALGLEALLVIPMAQRWEYLHLEEWPDLIIEVLLMNGNLELIGKVLERAEFITPDFVTKVDAMLELFAKRALELNSITGFANKRASITPHSKRPPVSSFVMPAKVPSVKEWVRDEEISKCMICHTKFSVLVRRHHCRRCGRIICRECSSKGRLLVEGHGKVPVRVCDDCFSQTTEPEVTEATEAIENFTPNALSKKVTPVKVETTWRIREPINEENREYNESTRRIFYYERAPSVSLCLSILDRHSDPEKAAEFILSLCDRLVALLVFPSEIDYGLVIAMMQTLLLKARFNLLEKSNQASLEWCESYLQTLDLIKLLVKDNCQDLIPKELLTQKNPANNDWRNVHRKLRDRLLDAERFHLALEISSKCNLETNAVLAAWGLSMLKAGDWALAREKLVQCLRRPSDMNNTKTESPLLKDILAVLNSSLYAGITRAAAVYCPLANLKNIKTNGVQYQSAPSTDHLVTVAAESWCYLENFACHSTIIAFLVRMKQLKRALEYCVNHRCENEVFIEYLFMPCLRSGALEQFFDEMAALDNYIRRFGIYLLSLCRYLERQSYTNTLHKVQIFMKDWLRAAMTSINFFEEETATLSMREIVANKLHHLVNAENYLEQFLARSLQSGQPQPGAPSSVHLSLPIKEIHRHLSTVSLQMDVARYLARKEKAQNGVLIVLPLSTPTTRATSPVGDGRAPVAASAEAPSRAIKPKPTLFSRHPNEKHDLAAMILLNGSTVEEGFGLCLRVVAECQLDGMEVLKKAVIYLSRAEQDGDADLEEIQRLTACVQQSGYSSSSYDMDKVLISVIELLQRKKLPNPETLNATIDSLLKLIKDDTSKVTAYTESGRLRSAYMLAVRLSQVDAVRRIREKATQLQQPAVYKMCDKWLQNRR